MTSWCVPDTLPPNLVPAPKLGPLFTSSSHTASASSTSRSIPSSSKCLRGESPMDDGHSEDKSRSLFGKEDNATDAARRTPAHTES